MMGGEGASALGVQNYTKPHLIHWSHNLQNRTSENYVMPAICKSISRNYFHCIVTNVVQFRFTWKSHKRFCPSCRDTKIFCGSDRQPRCVLLATLWGWKNHGTNGFKNNYLHRSDNWEHLGGDLVVVVVEVVSHGSGASGGGIGYVSRLVRLFHVSQTRWCRGLHSRIAVCLCLCWRPELDLVG